MFFVCVSLGICVILDGIHHQLVIRGCAEPPTALTSLNELLALLSLSLSLHREGVETTKPPTCNYPTECNATPSPYLLLCSLKMPHRELVVISTHDSLITPLRFSRNTSQDSERSRGKAVRVCR